MEVCRLCLDLLSDSNCTAIDDKYEDMVQVVVPELNLEISAKPVVCNGCKSNIDELFIFKSNCFENEEKLREKIVDSDKNKLSLKEVLDGVSALDDNILKTEKAKERVCRTCLEPIECDSFTVLKPSKPDAYLDSMLITCLPEIELDLTRDPVMCETCLENLQRLHQFKSSCVDVEDKLTNYCGTYGTNSSNKINLHSVLESDVTKMESEFVAIKSEKDVNVKSEIDVEMKTEADMNHEEIEIKSEADTSNSDKLLKRRSIENSTAPANHIQLFSKKRKTIQCYDCKKVFFSRYSYTEHMKNHNEGNGSTHCDICNKTLESRSTYLIHQQLHLGNLPHKCGTCQKKFTNRNTLRRHELGHAQEKIFKCDKCEASFTTSNSLIKHLGTHLKDTPFACDLCGKKYAALFQLKKHKNIHNRGRPFKCDLCEKSYIWLRELNRHRDSHFPKTKTKEGYKFECNLCQKKFASQYILNKHVEIHTTEKNFECDQCDKKYTLERYLRRHKKSHQDTKRFECDQCEKKFLFKQDLQRHKVVHTGEKLFKCDVCDKAYAQLSGVLGHRKSGKCV